MRNIRLLREFISLSLNEVPSGERAARKKATVNEPAAAETGTSTAGSKNLDLNDKAIKTIISKLSTFLARDDIKAKIAAVADDLNNVWAFTQGDANAEFLSLLTDGINEDLAQKEHTVFPVALSVIILGIDQGDDTLLNQLFKGFSNESILRNTSKQQLNEFLPAMLGIGWGAITLWGLLFTATAATVEEMASDGSLNLEQIKELGSLKEKIIKSFGNVAKYAGKINMGDLSDPLKNIASSINDGTYQKSMLKALADAIPLASNSANLN